MGSPDVGQVRTRAEELARINGHAQYTEEDWQQARFELHGGTHAEEEMADEFSNCRMVSEADMVCTDVGHHTARTGMEDDDNVGAELVREGMEEAEHERMLAARMNNNGDLDEELDEE